MSTVVSKLLEDVAMRNSVPYQIARPLQGRETALKRKVWRVENQSAVRFWKVRGVKGLQRIWGEG